MTRVEFDLTRMVRRMIAEAVPVGARLVSVHWVAAGGTRTDLAPYITMTRIDEEWHA